VDDDDIVGIAPHYGVEDVGSEIRWGREFLHPFRPALWANQPTVDLVEGLVLGGKAVGV